MAEPGIRMDYTKKALPIETDPVAQQLWRQLYDPLRQAGVLTDVDLPAFGLLCRIYSELQRAVGREFRELLARYISLCKAFGLTPAARKAMGIVTLKVDDDDF